MVLLSICYDLKWHRRYISFVLHGGRRIWEHLMGDNRKMKAGQCRHARGEGKRLSFLFALEIDWLVFVTQISICSDPDTRHSLNSKEFSFLNSNSFSPKESESFSIAVCYNISTGYICVVSFLAIYQWLWLFCSGLWIVEGVKETLNWGSPDV